MSLRQAFDDLGLSHVDLIEKEETVSSSTDCREQIKTDAPHRPFLILAHTQTGGRGRQGKSFSSPKGGLYMSLALRTETEITQTVRITSAAAVAVCRAIRTVCGLECEIKWVNDIYKNGNKLCGILTEAINDYAKGTTEYLILGIGVNLTEHPTELNATDLLAETGQAVDRDRLCAEITKELLAVLDQIIKGDSAYMNEYRRRSCVIGREIKLIKQDTETIGTAVGIDDEGGLTVTFPDGRTETLTSGEISLRFLK